MDLEPSPETIDDVVVDHHLRTALQVDPSPEFLARVRARVARETPPRRWYWWSLRASAAAVMAGVIVLAALATHRQTPSVSVVVENPSATPARPAPDLTPWLPPEAIATPPGAAVRPRSLRREPLRTNGRDATGTKSSDERRGLRVLLDGARNGDPMILALLAADRSLDTAPEPIQDLRLAPISVPPVTIEPLPPTH